MGTLAQLGKDHARRQRVLDDCVVMLDAEVAGKGGLSGIAIKGAYGLLARFRPGMTRKVLDHFLDPFLAALEPMYADFQRSGGKDLAAYFKVRAADVAELLLQITDSRAAAADGALRPLKAAYSKLRPMAAKHVEAAVPQLALVLGRHVAA